MKSQVLHTVCCDIYGEATGEIRACAKVETQNNERLKDTGSSL